ncbi:MAG: biotin/lipoyl-containing protein [Nitrospinota bacterium]
MEVRAQFPARVIEVKVKEGDEVKVGDTLLVVELMKMHQEVQSEGNGRVRAIHVSPGDPMAVGQVLVEFE